MPQRGQVPLRSRPHGAPRRRSRPRAAACLAPEPDRCVGPTSQREAGLPGSEQRSSQRTGADEGPHEPCRTGRSAGRRFRWLGRGLHGVAGLALARRLPSLAWRFAGGSGAVAARPPPPRPGHLRRGGFAGGDREAEGEHLRYRPAVELDPVADGKSGRRHGCARHLACCVGGCRGAGAGLRRGAFGGRPLHHRCAAGIRDQALRPGS
mmetsp:Transcript_8904/g.19048  ORF Transcript_8904/g.19048 Transcript_8904/m.19048 type:complete len:208 (-) Transcript_8904:190-813(-)